MSEIELLMIGFTMVLATGLVRCIEGLYHATMSPQSYWIPQVLLWGTFIYGLSFLWAFRDNLSDTTPTYIFYASSIAFASLFFLRTYVIATANAAKVEDWALHFQKTARPYFVIAALTSLLSIVVAWSAGESTGFDSVSIPFWLGVMLNATGAIFDNTRIRGVIAVILLMLVVIGSYVLFSNDMV
jgi:hypothetical protein